MDTGKARKRTCPQRYRSSKEKHIQESASIAAFAVLGSGLREKSPWTSIEDRVLGPFSASRRQGPMGRCWVPPNKQKRR